MWEQFLSTHRVGTTKPSFSDASRSEFHKDYDRVIFSSAFRRLSDKTQVVPFPKSDYTRQRLTHSLEVSCVGRSLATHVYSLVCQDIASLVSQGDFEAIVATACLAHDIGNPPFGHFGERAIQDWAKETLQTPRFGDLTDAERADLTQFEGNAQGFRVLTRLQMSNRRGGMRLTAATLGTLIKYPRPSLVSHDARYRKHGFFQQDQDLFDEVFQAIGRFPDQAGQYARHPLVLLSEAADDICYGIIDLEDGCRAGLISEADAFAILEEISPGSTGSESIPGEDRISMGRAMVINTLVNQCIAVFEASLSEILSGSFTGSLVERADASNGHRQATRIAAEQVFRSERVLELEAAGYQAIRGLMDVLSNAVLTDDSSGFDEHVRRLTGLHAEDECSTYDRLLRCTDYVSGMTDRSCINLSRRLSGHPVHPQAKVSS